MYMKAGDNHMKINIGNHEFTELWDGVLYKALSELSADGRIQFSNHAAKLSSVEVEKLFERFYTVETARNSTGIGLSIARLLTERMGGDITVEYKDGQLYIQIAF